MSICWGSPGLLVLFGFIDIFVLRCNTPASQIVLFRARLLYMYIIKRLLKMRFVPANSYLLKQFKHDLATTLFILLAQEIKNMTTKIMPMHIISNMLHNL